MYIYIFFSIIQIKISVIEKLPRHNTHRMWCLTLHAALWYWWSRGPAWHTCNSCCFFHHQIRNTYNWKSSQTAIFIPRVAVMFRAVLRNIFFMWRMGCKRNILCCWWVTACVLFYLLVWGAEGARWMGAKSPLNAPPLRVARVPKRCQSVPIRSVLNLVTLLQRFPISALFMK